MTNLAFGPLAVIILYRSDIASNFGVPHFLITCLYSLYFLLGGWAGRKFEARLRAFDIRRLLVTGATSIAVGSVVCVYSQSYLVFAGAFLFAISLVGIRPFLAPLAGFVVRANANKPGSALAIATAGQLTSFGFWWIVFEIFGVRSHWHSALAIAGPCAGIVLIGLGMSLNVQNSPSSSSPTVLSTTIPSFQAFYLVAAALSLIGAAGTLFITSLPILESGRTEIARATFVVVVFSFSAFCGRMIFALMFDRGYRRESLWVAISSFTISLSVMTFFQGGASAVYLGTTLIGIGYGGFLPIVLVYCSRLWPHKIETIIALFFYWGGAGVAFGSLLSGIMAEYGLIEVSIFTGAGQGFLAFLFWCAFEIWVLRGKNL
jgi:predicted MFS family arabinose efflux permease